MSSLREQHGMQLNPIRKGMNLWPAIQWEASADPLDQERLETAIIRLKSIGVSWVRILASTQCIGSPHSIRPAIQGPDDAHDQRSAEILLRLLDRLQRHELQAVVMLGNFWSWSGGFPAYAEWAGRKRFPVIGPDASLFDMARFFIRAAGVFSDAEVMKRYHRLLNAILDHVPADHRAILSFQLANEPTPFFYASDLHEWAEESTKIIRSRAPGLPLSLGGIGEGPLPMGTRTGLVALQERCRFDYLTVHIWPENWGWYDPKRPEKTFERAWKKTRAYLESHGELARRFGTPLLVEELNLARDCKSLDPRSPTTWRDRYLQRVHEELDRLKHRGCPIAGIAYWTWELDPPHEPQGWYGIHSTDETTLRVIREFSNPSAQELRPR